MSDGQTNISHDLSQTSPSLASCPAKTPGKLKYLGASKPRKKAARASSHREVHRRVQPPAQCFNMSSLDA